MPVAVFIILNTITLSVCCGGIKLPETLTKACPDLASVELPARLKFDERDEQLLQEINSRKMSTSVRCVSELVELGLIQSAAAILSELKSKEEFGHRERSDLSVSIQRKQSQLEALIKLSLLTSTKLEARPAAKWGQSFEEVTFFLKYASRIDSPGCNDVTEQSEQVKIINGAMQLSVTGLCVLAGRPVRFVLDLPLFEEVQPSSIKTVAAGVGASIITIKKKKVGIWPQIWKRGFNKKGIPITVWWELSGAQFEKGMKAFRKMRQELDDEDSEGLWQDNPRRVRVDDQPNWIFSILRKLKVTMSALVSKLF